MSRRLLRSNKRAGDQLLELSVDKRPRKRRLEENVTITDSTRRDDEPLQNEVAGIVEIDTGTLPFANHGHNDLAREEIPNLSDLSEGERAQIENAMLAAARRRMEVKKRAIQEWERLQLEMIDFKYQEELREIGEQSSTGSLYTRSGYAQSVVEWVAHLPNPSTATRILDVSRERNYPTSTRSEHQAVHQQNIHLSPMSKAAADLAVRLTTLRGLESQQVLPAAVNQVSATRTSQNENDNGLSKRTEEENVLRLHCCLQGEAKETVASLLTASANGQPIHDSLQLRFENPSILAQSMAREIRHLPTIDDRNNNIVSFAVKLRNCVSALEAVGDKGLLHSLELVYSIIQKMPLSLIPMYNRFFYEKRSLEEPALVTLSLFLYKEAE